MNVSFVLFADAANISQEGKLHILGIFDAVHISQFPGLHPRATLVLGVKSTLSDRGVHGMVLSWVNPRGTELWSTEAKIEVGASPPGTTDVSMPVILQIDLPLDMLGDFRMNVTLDGQQQTGAVLHVRGGSPMIPPASGQMVS